MKYETPTKAQRADIFITKITQKNLNPGRVILLFCPLNHPVIMPPRMGFYLFQVFCTRFTPCITIMSPRWGFRSWILKRKR